MIDRLPRPAAWALNLLSLSLSVSALCRGIDFIGSPNNQNATLSALNEWMSPDHLGYILITLALSAIIGVIVQSPTLQALSNIALSGVFLVMGCVSFFPVVWTIGWGWRAPVSYILGSACVHWYIAHEWFNKWVEARGRHEIHY